jgi:hypothetical protein
MLVDSKSLKAVDFPPPEEEPKSTSVKAPGQQHRFVRWYQAPIDRSEDILETWKRGEEALMVWGRIDYEDIFGNPRWSTFRLMVPVDGIGDKGGYFIACEHGNDAK